MAQIFQTTVKEFAFRGFKLKPFFGQLFEYTFQSGDMVIWILGKDDNIIQIDDTPIQMELTQA